MATSPLFHKNYQKHKGVITELKSTLNPDKTSKAILCGGNKGTVWKTTEITSGTASYNTAIVHSTAAVT